MVECLRLVGLPERSAVHVRLHAALSLSRLLARTEVPTGVGIFCLSRKTGSGQPQVETALLTLS
jgi:hypothetical protein